MHRTSTHLGNLARAGVTLVAILLAPEAASAVESPATGTPPAATPGLALCLIDQASLPAEILAAARREADAIFTAEGVALSWGIGAEPAPEEGGCIDDQPEIQVLISRSDPARVGVPEGVMGLTLGGGKDRPMIFVFVEALAETLGDRVTAEYDPTGSKPWIMALALGRVIAHEIVHAIAPQLSHASRGLMARQQGSRSLRSSRIELDSRSADAVRLALTN